MKLTVSVPEAAEILGVSTTAVYDHVRAGDIPNVGLPGAVRIPRVWLERRFAAAGAPLDLETVRT